MGSSGTTPPATGAVKQKPETPPAAKGPRPEDPHRKTSEGAKRSSIPVANSRQSPLSAVYTPRGILRTGTSGGEKNITLPRVTFLETPPRKRKASPAKPNTCTKAWWRDREPSRDSGSRRSNPATGSYPCRNPGTGRTYTLPPRTP